MCEINHWFVHGSSCSLTYLYFSCRFKFRATNIKGQFTDSDYSDPIKTLGKGKSLYFLTVASPSFLYDLCKNNSHAKPVAMSQLVWECHLHAHYRKIKVQDCIDFHSFFRCCKGCLTAEHARSHSGSLAGNAAILLCSELLKQPLGCLRMVFAHLSATRAVETFCRMKLWLITAKAKNPCASVAAPLIAVLLRLGLCNLPSYMLILVPCLSFL